MPEARPGVGVKVAVRVRPVPLMAPSVPPVVVMSASANPIGASLKVKVIVAVSPAFTAATLLVMASVGASVSMLRIGDDPAPPALPAASVYAAEATVMLAWSAATPAVGVKVAVRVRPVPLNAPSAPPVVVISPAAKLLPGSSLKVKVIVAVSPAFTAATLLLMASVGAKVSIAIVGVVPAAPALPAASVYLALATVMLALPEARPGVGVKVAVRVRPLPLIALKLPPLTTTSPGPSMF